MEEQKSFKPLNLFEYEQLATKCLSQMALDYYASGAWDEITLRDNRTAFERFKLRPRVLVKALALGAKAVLVGRPVLWGLAVAGEAGVAHVIDILRDELDVAMALSGCASVEKIDSSLLFRENHHSA